MDSVQGIVRGENIADAADFEPHVIGRDVTAVGVIGDFVCHDADDGSCPEVGRFKRQFCP